MKKVSVVMIITLGLLASAQVSATTSPTIGGSAKINANLEGAVINAGGAVAGASVNVKQAVASVLAGKITGKLSDKVTVKGALTNIGGGASAGKTAACQSVGTIGSDCEG